MADETKQAPELPRGQDDLRTASGKSNEHTGAKDDPSKAPESGDRKATG